MVNSKVPTDLKTEKNMLWRLQKLIKITIYEMFDSEISEEKTPAFLYINKLTIFHSIYYFFFLKEKRKVKTEWYSFLCVYIQYFNFFFQHISISFLFAFLEKRNCIWKKKQIFLLQHKQNIFHIRWKYILLKIL